MREQLKEIHGAAYAVGRGGVQVMGAADWAQIDRMVLDQMRYLARFSRDVAAGKLTERQIAARARLYAHSARGAFEVGKIAAFGIVLPVHPCDGGTACLANCRCWWELRIRPPQGIQREPRVVATWRLGRAEHCADCIARSIRYRVYIVVLPEAQRAAAA